MKKNLFFLLLLVSFFFVLPLSVSAGIADRVEGNILLQVEDDGQAWYVIPGTKKRAFLGRPADAFRIMRELGVGISETDYNSWGTKAPIRLSGKILLRVQANGEAYYVNPANLEMKYLGRPADAFRIMREVGLGITTADLNEIIVEERYKETKNVSVNVENGSSGSSGNKPESDNLAVQIASHFYNGLEALINTHGISSISKLELARIELLTAKDEIALKAEYEMVFDNEILDIIESIEVSKTTEKSTIENIQSEINALEAFKNAYNFQNESELEVQDYLNDYLEFLNGDYIDSARKINEINDFLIGEIDYMYDVKGSDLKGDVTFLDELNTQIKSSIEYSALYNLIVYNIIEEGNRFFWGYEREIAPLFDNFSGDYLDLKTKLEEMI